jgi:hypothetical protein
MTMIKSNAHPQVTMEVVNNPDPAEVAALQRRRERFARNNDWFEAHLDEILAAHYHKHVCVAGEELFVGDSIEEALAKAKAAHPEDDGSYYTAYIRREKVWKIYAQRRKPVGQEGR